MSGWTYQIDILSRPFAAEITHYARAFHTGIGQSLIPNLAKHWVTAEMLELAEHRPKWPPGLCRLIRDEFRYRRLLP